jgi:hypothetical protein
MNPLMKIVIASVIEGLLILAFFAMVDGGSIHHEPTFSMSDAMLWTFVSIMGFGFVIYSIKRSSDR